MLISICIPTYNSGEKLERLLNSVAIQTYKNFEIIISDDSRNDSVKEIIDTKYSNLPIHYYKNETALGTPNNWNNAVSKSKGDWINLMHHDDWFINENSLQKFAEAAQHNSLSTIIFCNYYHIYTDKGNKEKLGATSFDIFLLKQNYLNLYKLFIGNPSCTLINKHYKPYAYDTTFKWLIDYDFYTSLFKKNKNFTFISDELVNLGMHSEQVTAFVFQNPKVEIPESIALIHKHGENILKNIFVYDFFWRMYRNLNIKSIEEFNNHLPQPCHYKAINDIINIQSSFKKETLNIGVLNKLFTVFYFFKNFFKN